MKRTTVTCLIMSLSLCTSSRDTLCITSVFFLFVADRAFPESSVVTVRGCKSGVLQAMPVCFQLLKQSLAVLSLLYFTYVTSNR
jgi:hypothetical protein